jgi:hypothetical protein
MMRLTQVELDDLLAEVRSVAVVKCRMLRPLAGGVPAADEALRAFIEHHLGLKGDEAQEAFNRIRKEESQTRETTPEGGEVKEEEVYAVNVLRRGQAGPFILEHQVKALLKQAASRLGLFQAKGKVGSKGDLAELGTVLAHGGSLAVPARPWEIYLGIPKETRFDVLSGSVNTPQGKKSIQHHTEVAPEGTTFSFEVRWPAKKLTAHDMAKVLAAATQVGIGSCLSMGYGRFEVVEATIEGKEEKAKDPAARPDSTTPTPSGMA